MRRVLNVHLKLAKLFALQIHRELADALLVLPGVQRVRFEQSAARWKPPIPPKHSDLPAREMEGAQGGQFDQQQPQKVRQVQALQPLRAR